MKNYLSALVFLTAPVFAGSIDLDFHNVGISQLSQAVVKGILRQDYVISPEAAAVESKVTLSVHGLDEQGVKETLNDVLHGVGLQMSERRGVLYLEKKGAMSDPAQVSPVAPGTQPAPQNERQSVPVFDQAYTPPVRKPVPVPALEDARVYFPKYRGADYLALAVRAAGAQLIDGSQAVVQPVQHDAYGQQQRPQVPTSTANSIWRDVLVYTGTVETIAKVEKLLVQLDRPSVAVQLRGAVLEVSDTSENIRSISGLLTMLGNRVGLQLDAGRAVGNALTLKGTNLNAVLSAVDGDTRFRYLSEPTMRVLEGETAKLIVGQDVPVRGAIQTDNNGNTLQSVEYKTAGLVFEVTPTVYESAFRLKIGQQISSFTSTTTSGIDSPTMLKREASTVVQAEDGELIAIAGLDETRETKSTSGVSFLPDFMKSKNDNSSRSQILLLLEVKRQSIPSL